LAIANKFVPHVLFKYLLKNNIMETNNENNKPVKNDLIDLDNENTEIRNEENIEKNYSSKVATTKFHKDHGRTNHAMGDGHEPGTIPGTGV